MKTNKSYTKRLKVTKTGKVIARRSGQCHLNAKESGNMSLKKKRSSVIKLSNKIRRQFLPRTK
ncbi:MAG: 50S ribosomal protein L35 [Patescibacteria group bacterium]